MGIRDLIGFTTHEPSTGGAADGVKEDLTAPLGTQIALRQRASYQSQRDTHLAAMIDDLR